MGHLMTPVSTPPFFMRAKKTKRSVVTKGEIILLREIRCNHPEIPKKMFQQKPSNISTSSWMPRISAPGVFRPEQSANTSHFPHTDVTSSRKDVEHPWNKGGQKTWINLFFGKMKWERSMEKKQGNHRNFQKNKGSSDVEIIQKLHSTGWVVFFVGVTFGRTFSLRGGHESQKTMHQHQAFLAILITCFSSETKSPSWPTRCYIRNNFEVYIILSTRRPPCVFFLLWNRAPKQ